MDARTKERTLLLFVFLSLIPICLVLLGVLWLIARVQYDPAQVRSTANAIATVFRAAAEMLKRADRSATTESCALDKCACEQMRQHCGCLRCPGDHTSDLGKTALWEP